MQRVIRSTLTTLLIQILASFTCEKNRMPSKTKKQYHVENASSFPLRLRKKDVTIFVQPLLTI